MATPDATPTGWRYRLPLGRTRMALLFYPDARTPTRRHHHAVTVQPSVACPDCGLHGWVHAGRWVPA